MKVAEPSNTGLVDAYIPGSNEERPPTSDDARAPIHEERVAARQKAQFQSLKDEARAIFGMVDGVPGVRSSRDWEKLLERAGDEIGNGKFIVRCLGR